MQCTVNIDRGCRALCSIGGKGDDNTYTSVQRNRFSRNQERSEQTGESVRNPEQRKAVAGLSSKDFRVHYSPQTTPQMSLLARAGSRVITGQTSEYGGVIQRCGAPEGHVEDGSKLRIEEFTPPGSTHPVNVYTDGNAKINTGKIDTYIRGKVVLDVEATTTRIAELDDIRKSNPEDFTKEMSKELKSCQDRLHNYQRSQEMSKTLNEAGIEDTIENNQMIVENLFDAAKNVTEENTIITSYIDGVNGKVQLESRWKILEDKHPYLATIILKPVKEGE